MKKLIYQVMFDKLLKIGLIDNRGYPVFGEHVKIVNKPYMDLSVDNLGSSTEKGYPVFRISLAHNFIQNGDLMADPDMEIRIYPYAGFVEALTYQLDSMGVYQVVYPEPGKVYPKIKKDLNRFLNQWLTNLIDQGFTMKKEQLPIIVGVMDIIKGRYYDDGIRSIDDLESTFADIIKMAKTGGF